MRDAKAIYPAFRTRVSHQASGRTTKPKAKPLLYSPISPSSHHKHSKSQPDPPPTQDRETQGSFGPPDHYWGPSLVYEHTERLPVQPEQETPLVVSYI